MLNFLLGFVVGGAVVDFAWAYKLGIPQRFWARIRGIFTK
jgi:hypothetical protein